MQRLEVSVAVRPPIRVVRLQRVNIGRSVGWGFVRTGWWGECLGLRERKWQEEAENCAVRLMTLCAAHHMLWGWYNQGGSDGRDLNTHLNNSKCVPNFNQKTKNMIPLGRGTCTWKDDFFCRTVQFGIYKVHIPRNALCIKLDKVLKFTLKITLTCCYMFRSTAIIRGPSLEPS